MARLRQRPTHGKTLYFDNSLLDAIDTEDVGGRVSAQLRAHGSVVFGSLENLIEIYGIEDVAHRAHLAKTFLRVARSRETVPRLHRLARAVVGELRRHHRDWINSRPDLTQVSEDLAWARRAWIRIRQDPTHRPSGYAKARPLLYANVGEAKQRQRRRRAEYLAGQLPRLPFLDPNVTRRLQPDIEAIPQLERIWRIDAGTTWWSAVMQNDPMVLSIRDSVGPYLLLDRLDFESWMRFWISEIDGKAVLDHRIEQLAGYFQVKRKISAGNSGDMRHAGLAAFCDSFVTADRAFFQVMCDIATVTPHGMAAPVFVDRSGGDVVVALRSALGW